jgi:hypothetical protein
MDLPGKLFFRHSLHELWNGVEIRYANARLADNPSA